jgi:hypothetical protein
MNKLTIAAATIAFGALISIPAQADNIAGAPMRNGNQCVNYSQGQAREGRFGTWGACPQQAALAVNPNTHHRVARHHR